jgi:hypothetical protein
LHVFRRYFIAEKYRILTQINEGSLVATAQVHTTRHVGVIDDRELKSTKAGWRLFALCL